MEIKTNTRKIHPKNVFFTNIMRTFIFLFCTISFAFSYNKGHTQDASILIKKEGYISVKKVFKILNNQAKYHFLYQDNAINNAPKVFVKKGIIKASSLLNKSLQPISFTYKFLKNKTVIVSKIKNARATTTTTTKINKLVQFQAKGNVTDKSGFPLPEASVIEKGTGNGVSTDFDGNFTIDLSSGNATLVVSYVGYVTQEVKVNNKTKLNIQLEEDAAALDEVVVVGYGSQSRKKVTGAISSIKSEQIKDLPVTSFDQALAGQSAGVQVSQGTGSPGKSSDIKIRGTGTLTAGSNPLLVIDGFPAESLSLSDINPNDIENIQVLKDAATASIYGSRGSNGVIIVTTKKGKNKDTEISFNTYTGFQEVTNTYNMADGYQWAEFQLETLRERNPSNFPSDYIPSLYRPYIEGVAGLQSTNWQDEIFRTAPISSYQLSVNGGNENTKYYVSGEVFNQDGVIIGSGFKRYNFRSNIESTIYNKEDNSFLKNVKLGVNLAPTYSVSDRISESHHSADGVVITALYAYPNIAPYNTDGSINLGEQINFSINDLRNSGWGGENPIGAALERKEVLKRFNLLGSTYLDFSLLDELNFKTYFGINYSNSENNLFRPSLIGKRKNPAPVTAEGRIDNNITFNYITENTFNFKKTFNDVHNLDVLAGFSFQKENISSDYIASRNPFANDLATFYGANTVIDADLIEEEWALASFISRATYDFKGKYLASLSFRRDGSSRFGENTKWGNFPSASFGWRASEEEFLMDNETLSDLKLRASWGVTGNNFIANYGGIALLEEANYGNLNGFSAATSPNSDLSWEETTQLDFGIDFGLFNNKISLIADYYKSTTDGLLLNVPVPAQSGFDTQLRNLGEVENKGFELAVSANKIKLGNVEWSASFNISANKNKVISLGTDQTQIISKFHKTEVGRPIGEFYLWNLTGVYNTQEEVDASAHIAGTAPGDYIIEDVNGDGIINDNDRKVVGNSQPDFTYGFSTSFKYKGFDISALLQGAKGNDVLNFNYFFISRRGDFANVTADRVEGRWQSPSNPGTGFARAGAREDHLDRSNRLLQKGDYLRVRNITIGYTLPESVLEKLGMDKIRMYVSSINPFTFTDYLGYNPEVTSAIGSLQGGALQPGVDWGNYPVAKSITVGLNVSF